MSKCGCGGWAGCSVSKVAKVLLVIGGLNWGLVGAGMLLGQMQMWNVVNMLLGSMPVVEGIVYLLVGIAALMSIFGCKCSTCKAACAMCASPDGHEHPRSGGM